MKLREFDLDKHERRKIPSPELCIYCGARLPPDQLSDEHVIPFALGHNTLVHEKSSCADCARTIQKYEQEVLKKQLGNFRLQVDAPSRTRPKDRPTSIEIEFIEVGDDGGWMRDLGARTFAVEEAPLALNLWQLPEARLLRGDTTFGEDVGRPWAFAEHRAHAINRNVANETGARNVAMKTGEVNREHFMRFLAKVAHAYASAELGVDGFAPLLNDLVLNKCGDVGRFVGGAMPYGPGGLDVSRTVLMQIGGFEDLVLVYFQIYPTLNTPAYAIVVGRRNEKTDDRIAAMALHYE